jgi:hypothetical protein
MQTSRKPILRPLNRSRLKPRYVELSFELATPRDETEALVLAATKKAINDWNEVSPDATCTVTLVTRHIHQRHCARHLECCIEDPSTTWHAVPMPSFSGC